MRFLPLFRRFKRVKLKSGVIVHPKDFNRLQSLFVCFCFF